MVALLEPLTRPRPNLLLHCGACAVEREQVLTVPTPRSTETWTPIPHIDLITRVEDTIKTNGLVIGTQAHSLSRMVSNIDECIFSHNVAWCCLNVGGGVSDLVADGPTARSRRDGSEAYSAA